MSSLFPNAMKVRVKSVTWETDLIKVYELCALDGADLPSFTAGAHVLVQLGDNFVRSYSLMNSPEERHRYVLGVALDRFSRGGSRYFHEKVHAGSELSVQAPINQFELNETAPHIILIGGGIGVTPLVSMANRLTNVGISWTMHYATRSGRDAAFHDVLSALGDSYQWHGDEEKGHLLDIEGIVKTAPIGTHFYCCGPSSMLSSFKNATEGVEVNRVHIEYFAPIQEALVAGGFDVVLARSGRIIPIAPGKTILDALHDCQIAVPSSCLQGVCGACETTVLSGVPDHRDVVLSDAERSSNKTMMICCSGSKGARLVLDL
jgi:vanillate O-demethylase ferredoxin subunit